MACSIRSQPEMSRNFVIAAPSGGYTAWTMYQVNDTVCIAGMTVLVSKDCVMYYNIPKVLVDCLTITSGNLANYTGGSKVYFDATTNAITHVADTNPLCGIVTLQPAAGDVLCEIHLIGTLEIAT